MLAEIAYHLTQPFGMPQCEYILLATFAVSQKVEHKRGQRKSMIHTHKSISLCCASNTEIVEPIALEVIYKSVAAAF